MVDLHETKYYVFFFINKSYLISTLYLRTVSKTMREWPKTKAIESWNEI